jgi:hypothetical protein
MTIEGVICDDSLFPGYSLQDEQGFAGQKENHAFSKEKAAFGKEKAAGKKIDLLPYNDKVRFLVNASTKIDYHEI